MSQITVKSSTAKPSTTNNLVSSESNIGIITVGHADAGKSTLCGHLLYKLNVFSDRDLQKLTIESQMLGKESFKYAFFMDRSRDERARGVTIQCCTRNFDTKLYHYTIIDAPGCRDFIKNMMSGASQADAAILMVPANKGGFETSIAKGNHRKCEIQGQTRQHARICHIFGIKQIIVCVNKMDDESVKYSQERFNEIKQELSKMLTKIGYKNKKIPFIPISALNGDNLTKISNEMEWYKGFSVQIKKQTINGFTLLDALENVIKIPKRDYNASFKLSVSGVYKLKGVGDVITGRVEQGTLTAGTNVGFYPTGCNGKIVSIEMNHKMCERAQCGDSIGVNISGLLKLNMPRVGDLMYIKNNDNKNNLISSKINEFVALVYVQDHPAKLKAAKYDSKLRTYSGGYTPIIHVRTAKAPCQMISINWKIGKSTNNIKQTGPLYIEAGDQAEVIFKMKNSKIPIYPFDECKPFGRIVCMDSNSLIMFGKVTKLIDDKYYNIVMYGYIRIKIENIYNMHITDDIKSIISMYLSIEK